MSEQAVNNFSLVSRLFGNLFYREPTDSILAGVFAWLQQQNLSQIWALDVDTESQKSLDALQMPLDLNALAQEYRKLFGENGSVSVRMSDYELEPEAFMAFRALRGMPEVESADHFGLILLTASWLEDNVDSVSAQQELFEQFLLPMAAKFLTKVESHANLPFYRALAYLTREMLAAMADELESE